VLLQHLCDSFTLFGIFLIIKHVYLKNGDANYTHSQVHHIFCSEMVNYYIVIITVTQISCGAAQREVVGVV